MTNKAKAKKPVDIEVGARVRAKRVALGMSQERLGEALGLTFQQVQKYEKGTNRIGSSRLSEIAKILKVPVSSLFGENGTSGGAAIDARINTRVRGQILDRIVEIDDPKFETALLHLLNIYPR